jgi:hypothetical protein
MAAGLYALSRPSTSDIRIAAQSAFVSTGDARVGLLGTVALQSVSIADPKACGCRSAARRAISTTFLFPSLGG